MKNLIKLNESDLRRIVNRVIKEDEDFGQTDIGEEELQDLIEEARDFLEMTCGYDLHDLNLMSEYDIVEALYDEGNDELAEEIEDLLNQEGFADFDEPYDSIGGHSVNDLKRAFAKTKGRDKELGEGFISESATVSGDSNNLKNLKTYLKELVDESVIDNDVKVHIMFLVKKLIEENKK